MHYYGLFNNRYASNEAKQIRMKMKSINKVKRGDWNANN